MICRLGIDCIRLVQCTTTVVGIEVADMQYIFLILEYLTSRLSVKTDLIKTFLMLKKM